MASKQTYECYVCKRNGFADIRVYLDGKTIYKNEDMSPHVHKQQQQQHSQSSNTVTEPATTAMKIINAKLDSIISLLESQYQSKV
jgi:hypothetical protein